MKIFIAKIVITLRPSILDVQGSAVTDSLHSLNFTKVSNVRIGKHIELEIKVGSEEEAENITRKACQELLVNPIMENYQIEIVSKSE